MKFYGVFKDMTVSVSMPILEPKKEENLIQAPFNGEKPKFFHYSEDLFLEELKKHFETTNVTHYSGEIQPTEFIMSHANSMDFLIGNVIKYTFRFGRKNGFDKSDLFKAVHYLSMMYHYVSKFENKNDNK